MAVHARTQVDAIFCNNANGVSGRDLALMILRKTEAPKPGMGKESEKFLCSPGVEGEAIREHVQDQLQVIRRDLWEFRGEPSGDVTVGTRSDMTGDMANTSSTAPTGKNKSRCTVGMVPATEVDAHLGYHRNIRRHYHVYLGRALSCWAR